MIIAFTVENYLSFKNKTSLNFKAAAIKELKDENTILSGFGSDEYLLKSLGIFGPNGSGKSNLIKALAFMKDFVLNSSKESNSVKSIFVQPFLLSTTSRQLPSVFEVTFYLKEEKFRYGFSVDEKQVQSEWLFCNVKSKEEKVFIRAEQNYSFAKNFISSAKDKLTLFTEVTRPNALFASVLAQFNDPLFQAISCWFDNIFIAPDKSHLGLVDYTASLMSLSDYRFLINNIIKNSDLGIERIQELMKEGRRNPSDFRDFIKNLNYEREGTYQVKTSHKVYDDGHNEKGITEFDLIQNESLGAQKFFGILGPILWALKEKKILVIDEIDSRLHSLLVEQIVSLFNSEKFNPNGAQLIFTSHNTNLIKKGLRRDQMIFAEKDNYGSSKIASLYLKHPKVRNDSSFDKDYLMGKYGAIPKLNTQLNLFKNEDQF
ncbi:MAG: AAA family ATPase [Ginsengibacter sp.]